MINQPVLLEIIDNSVAGGAEKSTMLISKEFLKLGYKVILVHPPGEYDSSFKTIEKLGGEVVILPIRTNPLSSVSKLRILIKERNISCIHSHQIRADFIVALATLGLRKLRKVTSVHCLIMNDVKNPFLRSFYYILSFFSYRCFHKVITVSVDVMRSISKYYFIKTTKVVSVMNSIGFDDVAIDESEKYLIKQQYNIHKNATILCCVGELSPRKNQALLIEVLNALPKEKEVVLVLLGKGQSMDMLKARVKELDLENKVIFAGHQKNIYDWVDIAHIYLQPSINDPLPRALLEAMYLKKACVTTNLSSIGEVIKHNETGLWIENDISAFTNAIITLIANNELRNRLGNNAHQFIIDNCSMTTMAKRIASLGEFA